MTVIEQIPWPAEGIKPGTTLAQYTWGYLEQWDRPPPEGGLPQSCYGHTASIWVFRVDKKPSIEEIRHRWAGYLEG